MPSVSKYVSPPTRVWGEYDGSGLQKQIKFVGKVDGNSKPEDIITGLCKLNQVIGGLGSFFTIKWFNISELDLSGLVQPDPNVPVFDGFQSFQGHIPEEGFSWGLGRGYRPWLTRQAEYLTTSSDHPFTVLSGEVRLEGPDLNPSADYFQTDAGIHAIKEGLDSGALEPTVLSPDQIIGLSDATLRIDGVPQGHVGYRYHKMAPLWGSSVLAKLTLPRG